MSSPLYDSISASFKEVQRSAERRSKMQTYIEVTDWLMSIETKSVAEKNLKEKILEALSEKLNSLHTKPTQKPRAKVSKK